MLIPGSGEVMGASKEGFLYLIDAGSLGHLGNEHAVQVFRTSKTEVNGGAVYWQSADPGRASSISGARTTPCTPIRLTRDGSIRSRWGSARKRAHIRAESSQSRLTATRAASFGPMPRSRPTAPGTSTAPASCAPTMPTTSPANCGTPTWTPIATARPRIQECPADGGQRQGLSGQLRHPASRHRGPLRFRPSAVLLRPAAIGRRGFGGIHVTFAGARFAWVARPYRKNAVIAAHPNSL